MDNATRNSAYVTYSGTAAEDLPEDSVVLNVICPDLTPGAVFGTVGAGITKTDINLKDRDGNTISTSVTSSNHIVATWDRPSNMRYPPLVKKGEPVEVFRRGDQDKFYWRTTGLGRSFRTTDRVHFEVGAVDPSNPGADRDDSNTYSAYLDSHNKKIGFKTSSKNGEACSFIMEADTGAGTFYISDNSESPGNRIFLDVGSKSGTPVFQVNLKTGITLKFEGDHAFIKIPKGLQISTGERIVFDSPLIVLNINKMGVVIINGVSVAINAATDVILSAGNVLGLNSIATKISGILVAGAIRISKLTKGVIGGSYNPPQISNPSEGQPSTPSNSADTNVSDVVTSLPVNG